MPKKGASPSPRKASGEKDSGVNITLKKFFKTQNGHQAKVNPGIKAALFFGKTPMSLINTDHQYKLPQVVGSAATNIRTVQENIIVSPTRPASPTRIQMEETVAAKVNTVNIGTTVGEPSIEDEEIDVCEVVEIGTQDDVVRSDKDGSSQEAMLIDDNDYSENPDKMCGSSPMQQSSRTTFGDASSSTISITSLGDDDVEYTSPPTSPNLTISCTATDDADVKIVSNTSTITCGSERLLQDKNAPTTILSLEMKNFMGFAYKKVNFGASKILNQPIGKSTIIIGIMLALGQDDILKVYGYKLMDMIKIGESIAVLKLEGLFKGQEFGNSIVVSKPVCIQRKLQAENGLLLPCVWKLKYKELKTIQQSLPHQKEMGLENLIKDLNDKRRCLMEKQELHNSKLQDVKIGSLSRDALVDIVADKDAIAKLELRVKNSEANLASWKAKLEEKRAKLNEQFASRYRVFSAAIGLKGDCVIDAASEEMIFAVWTKLDGCNRMELKQRFAVSTLKYKSLALVILIICFWEDMKETPFFAVDAQNLLEDRFVEFKKLVESRPLQQLIFG